MTEGFKFKDSYGIQDLAEIVRILRAPGGCPWDREQTHKTIRRDFLEETYEVIEAINKNDTELLKEELGDVLLQVVFHSQIETEKGSFDLNDVADGICKKMIERHPHVFGGESCGTPEESKARWDEIKRQEKEARKNGVKL